MRGSGCDGWRSGKGALAVGEVVGGEGAVSTVSDFEAVCGVTRLEYGQMVFASLPLRDRTSFLCEVERAMVGGAAGVEEVRDAREEL